MKRILIVDDEIQNFEIYCDLLKSNYLLYHAQNSKEALEYLPRIKPDLILMDFFLGNSTGADCTKLIRQNKEYSALPIIFVSCSDHIDQKREAFENGANDYLAKPFMPDELQLRIEANISYSKIISQLRAVIRFGNMIINPNQRTVQIDGSEVRLTTREYSILYYLIENKNQVVSSRDLIEKVWGDLNITQGNIYTQMYNLKAKLKMFSGELVTHNRVGFRLIEQREEGFAV